MEVSSPNEMPFIQACRKQTPNRLPIWIMRQAGRYLPEYRAVREKVSFETLCRTPELAAEVTLQPIRRYDFDASIIFSDILVVSDALGCPIHFPKGGPKAEKPIRETSQIEALIDPDVDEALGYVSEAIKLVRAELPKTTALIGFAGAPLTVASYMVEGGASKTFSHLKTLIFREPAAANLLLSKIAKLTARYLRAQVQAGANAIQLFDTWASVVPKQDYFETVLPHVQSIFADLADLDVPKIYFAKGASQLFEYASQTGADVAGVDWSLSINEARSLIGDNNYPVQGNLDPMLLLSDEKTLRKRVRNLIDGVSNHRGYIFNLGHGIDRQTNPEMVTALVDEVRKTRLNIED